VGLQLWEDGKVVKVNPLAWWEFKDCMDYLERKNLERHPLHEQVSPHGRHSSPLVPSPVGVGFLFVPFHSLVEYLQMLRPLCLFMTASLPSCLELSTLPSCGGPVPAVAHFM
jgi:3'-phosphoadenosine 5'-phosphosulfate sulfotransferase (PAPS reductase)/FAD synthetase